MKGAREGPKSRPLDIEGWIGRVRELYEKAGLTQGEFHERVNAHIEALGLPHSVQKVPSTFKRYMTGDASKPDPRWLAAVADFFGVTLDWLLTGRPPKDRGKLEAAVTAAEEEQESLEFRLYVAVQNATDDLGVPWPAKDALRWLVRDLYERQPRQLGLGDDEELSAEHVRAWVLRELPMLRSPVLPFGAKTGLCLSAIASQYIRHFGSWKTAGAALPPNVERFREDSQEDGES